MDYRLIIIGGGASGLAAAVRAAAGGIDGIAILEKLPRTGKKILATGNGRCNLSHSGITAALIRHRCWIISGMRRISLRPWDCTPARMKPDGCTPTA